MLPNTYYAKVSGPLIQRVAFAIRQLWGIAMNEGLFVYLVTYIFAMVQLITGYIRVGQGDRRQLYGFDTVFAMFEAHLHFQKKTNKQDLSIFLETVW